MAHIIAAHNPRYRGTRVNGTAEDMYRAAALVQQIAAEILRTSPTHRPQSNEPVLSRSAERDRSQARAGGATIGVDTAGAFDLGWQIG